MYSLFSQMVMAIHAAETTDKETL